nr:DUF6221 family protein [Streptomyces caniscabiei]
MAEDEATARAATPGPWKQSGIGEYGWGVSFSSPGAGVEADDSAQGRADADHIARHHPDRVLREVEGRRQLLALHEPTMNVGTDSDPDDPATYVMCCGTCQIEVVKPGDWPCEHLRLLALPYADHPDYDEAWRP